MATESAPKQGGDRPGSGVRAGIAKLEIEQTPVLGTLAPKTPAGARHSSLDHLAGSLRGRVLVLNASYEPINVCTVRRAIVLVLKQKAEVLDSLEAELRSERSSMTRPSVIRLRSYVHIPHQSFRRKITRRAVFARDGWECQYCGRNGSLTMDHVVPRSKGGETSWENVVACCATCNRRKGDRSVTQSGMKLRCLPSVPHSTIFIHVASPKIPAQWLPYVPARPTKSESAKIEADAA